MDTVSYKKWEIYFFASLKSPKKGVHQSEVQIRILTKMSRTPNNGKLKIFLYVQVLVRLLVIVINLLRARRKRRRKWISSVPTMRKMRRRRGSRKLPLPHFMTSFPAFKGQCHEIFGVFMNSFPPLGSRVNILIKYFT
jgi:hypothetical protein